MFGDIEKGRPRLGVCEVAENRTDSDSRGSICTFTFKCKTKWLKVMTGALRYDEIFYNYNHIRTIVLSSNYFYYGCPLLFCQLTTQLKVRIGSVDNAYKIAFREVEGWGVKQLKNTVDALFECPL